MFLIVFGSIFTYFLIGFFIAVWMNPVRERAWSRRNSEFRTAKESMQAWFAVTMLIWPIIATISGGAKFLRAAVELNSAERAERKRTARVSKQAVLLQQLDARQRRIDMARAEKDLGLESWDIYEKRQVKEGVE